MWRSASMVKAKSIATNFLHLGMIQVSNALLQLLLFPLIIRNTGLEAFGLVVVANSFAALAGLLVNFGTSISGVQAVTSLRGDRHALSVLFTQTMLLRLLLLLPVVGCLPMVYLLAPPYFTYILPAFVLVVAEALNPLYFFNGQENLLPFNMANLAAKLVSALLVLVFVNGAADAPLVNLLLGLPALLAYMVLNIVLFRQYQLHWQWQGVAGMWQMLRKNMPLTGNNLAVQLQQSFFLFVLSAAASPLVLAGYAIIDKIIWGFRLVLIAFSNALFPRAVQIAIVDPAIARQRKKQINTLLTVLFTLVALVLYLFPSQVVWVFSGTAEPRSASLVKAICWVPLLAALNTLNVLEMLVQHRYNQIFRIAILLTLVTITASLLIIKVAGTNYIGWYPFIVEAAALGFYTFFLYRNKKEVRLAA
ncbi:hypothetical protein BUE76_17055 [Cnuella takakiae]|nr:hypothetical protein BUE76_17055 [Cnuella takakiae]